MRLKTAPKLQENVEAAPDDVATDAVRKKAF